MAYRVSFRGNNGLSLGPIGFLIATNLILLIVTLILPDLRYELGLSPYLFLSRPWTIFTNLFIHAGIWHFFTNMLTLYFFGSYLIGLIGNRNFLVVYFLAGLLGNAVYLWLGPEYSVAIGASGAVFGISGALTILKPKLSVFIMPIPVPIPLWISVIGGFALLSIPALASNIAWQAHLGGLVLGLIAGLIFKRRSRWQLNSY
jgi:membrane associated rhomboid family serine protease